MTRALVLGGGGVTGVAWELGLLAGLAQRGLELAGADLVVGTSAGSVVGAQVCSGVPLEELYAAQLPSGSGLAAGRASHRPGCCAGDAGAAAAVFRVAAVGR
ncbi:patatin-like phospholipase family protein [Micromonospora sp. ATA51]|uniref:patatin-like phospholipase family protein n=1 Tax=Micromonospora sp. ATA51 TaxID=2806098 RepID=UPI0035CA0C91